MVQTKVLVLGGVLAILLAGGGAEAQESFDGRDIELYRGPIVGPANVVGMGGAAIGLAEGSGSQAFNPAAVASRYQYNGGEWFDWDWALDWLLVGIGDTLGDIQNSGRAGEDNASTLLNAALNFVFGRFGIGIEFQFGALVMGCPELDCAFQEVRYESLIGGITAGYNFLDGELIVGAELTVPTATIHVKRQSDSAQLELLGNGVTFGTVWRPTGLPFRLGATFRLPITAKPDSTSGEADFPRAMVVPWQAGLGVVYSFGPRTLNNRLSFGDDDRSAREEYATPMWREYWLVALDLVLIGASERAGGIEAWGNNELQPAGASPALSVRMGAEAEFWPRVMRARLGWYVEPSRFETIGRIHGTAGIDVRLFELIWEWRFTGGVDVAPSYLNTMLSIGFWH